jgi:hypothetical protein
MKIEREALFRQLEPPPGGAARLRARLGSPSAGPPSPAWWLGPAAVAVIAAVVVLALRLVPDVEPTPEPGALMTAAAFDRLLRRESAPYELSITRDDVRLEVTELRSNNPSVRLYHIDPAGPQPAATVDTSP